MSVTALGGGVGGGERIQKWKEMARSLMAASVKCAINGKRMESIVIRKAIFL